jgi:hypothetical protein
MSASGKRLSRRAKAGSDGSTDGISLRQEATLMKDENENESTPTFRRPRVPVQRAVDRYEEMTLRYNYLKDLREASKPDLYGAGIDFYEEERIIMEQNHER